MSLLIVLLLFAPICFALPSALFLSPHTRLVSCSFQRAHRPVMACSYKGDQPTHRPTTDRDDRFIKKQLKDLYSIRSFIGRMKTLGLGEDTVHDVGDQLVDREITKTELSLLWESFQHAISTPFEKETPETQFSETNAFQVLSMLRINVLHFNMPLAEYYSKMAAVLSYSQQHGYFRSETYKSLVGSEFLSDNFFYEMVRWLQANSVNDELALVKSFKAWAFYRKAASPNLVSLKLTVNEVLEGYVNTGSFERLAALLSMSLARSNAWRYRDLDTSICKEVQRSEKELSSILLNGVAISLIRLFQDDKQDLAIELYAKLNEQLIMITERKGGLLVWEVAGLYGSEYCEERPLTATAGGLLDGHWTPYNLDMTPLHELLAMCDDADIIAVTIEKNTKISNASTFMVQREDHTLGNMLRFQLLAHKSVLFAGYRVAHPLEPVIELKVQTKKESTPAKAMNESLYSLIVDLGSLKSQFEAEVARVKGATAATVPDQSHGVW